MFIYRHLYETKADALDMFIELFADKFTNSADMYEQFEHELRKTNLGMYYLRCQDQV